MNETDNEKCSLNKKEQLLIEGYKALMQYGCQMSQDHISTDRIMVPLSLAPALLALAPPYEHIPSPLARTLILAGGVILVEFWKRRNKRNERRLYAIWDVVSLIEKQFGFQAYRTVQLNMNAWLCDDGRFQKPPRHDFTLKKWFGWIALVFYVVGVYVWCPDVVSWFCC